MQFPRFLALGLVVSFGLALPCASQAQVNCMVQPDANCPWVNSDNTCNTSRIGVWNARCENWNSALERGMWPFVSPHDSTPKPMGITARRTRQKLVDACIKKEMNAGTNKPDAVMDCADRLSF